MDKFDPKAWLGKAKDDLRWSEHDLGGGIFYGACFAAQQAVEKALKAYLLARGEKLKKVHDLVMLLDGASKHDASFGRFRKEVALLSQYYIETRYPDIVDSDSQTEEQTIEAFSTAKKIVEFVEEKLAS